MEKIQILEQISYSFNTILFKEKKKLEHINNLENFIGKPKYESLIEVINILLVEIRKERVILNEYLEKYKKTKPLKKEIEIAYNYINSENLYPNDLGVSIVNEKSSFIKKLVTIKEESCTDIIKGDSKREILIPNVFII